jgi:hypothetical protein
MTADPGGGPPRAAARSTVSGSRAARDLDGRLNSRLGTDRGEEAFDAEGLPAATPPTTDKPEGNLDGGRVAVAKLSQGCRGGTAGFIGCQSKSGQHATGSSVKDGITVPPIRKTDAVDVFEP